MHRGAPRGPSDAMADAWRQILRFVVPVTGAYGLEGAATLVPIWAAAHGGQEGATQRVGAVGLGNTVVICVALVVKSGWAGAQDTLVSQAYGVQDHDRARDHLLPARICMRSNRHCITLKSC